MHVVLSVQAVQSVNVVLQFSHVEVLVLQNWPGAVVHSALVVQADMLPINTAIIISPFRYMIFLNILYFYNIIGFMKF